MKHLKSGKLERRYARMGYVFMIPWFIGAALFLAYPLCMSFWYALNNIRITPLGQKFTFLGYGNFTQILIQDPDFVVELVNYLTSTILSVPIIVVFALIIAMMLNMNIKGKGFFRLIFFLPVIIVSGPILGMLNAEGAGSISAVDVQAISGAIGSVLPPIIAEPISDLFSNMITTLWYSGVQILIFLSGLQKIDKSMYEAAKIDGGSGWECFWKITLPNLRSMILLNTIYTVVFISNNSENPIIVLIKESMFSGTKEKGYGYASAMAWLYSLVVLLLVGAFALVLAGRKDQYEKQVKRAIKQRKKEAQEKKRIERRNRRNAAR
ncbi:MAG: sugar ABC transporter permease, partial [Oscillospiraceae bacterium]|nr:sugar ABC transporter permease [Oscillospiraceae bacterium]